MNLQKEKLKYKNTEMRHKDFNGKDNIFKMRNLSLGMHTVNSLTAIQFTE